MRVAMYAAAAIVMASAGLVLFGIGHGAGPNAVLAQEPGGGAKETPPPPGATDKRAGDKSLADKLAERHDYEFVETPLKDAVSLLQKQSGIQFMVNVKRLEEVGVNIDTPVTKNFRQMRLGTFLELLLYDLDLVYVQRDDELIVITTRDDAASTMEVRVYNCRDLLELAIVGPAVPGAVRDADRGGGGGFGGGGGGGFFGALSPGALPGPGGEILAQQAGLEGAAPPAAPGGEIAGGECLVGMLGGGAGAGVVTEHDLRADRLIRVIVTAVDPDSWTDIGGPGSISEFGGLIVVSQSARTHKKVEHVLDMLREAAGLEVGGVKKVVR